MKNQLTKSVVLMLLGIAFLIWGAIIYNQHPLMDIAKQIRWQATLGAKYQYITGIILLVASYVVAISNKK